MDSLWTLLYYYSNVIETTTLELLCLLCSVESGLFSKFILSHCGYAQDITNWRREKANNQDLQGIWLQNLTWHHSRVSIHTAIRVTLPQDRKPGLNDFKHSSKKRTSQTKLSREHYSSTKQALKSRTFSKHFQMRDEMMIWMQQSKVSQNILPLHKTLISRYFVLVKQSNNPKKL